MFVTEIEILAVEGCGKRRVEGDAIVPGLRQVPEGLPKVARQFYWRVAVVDFESRAVGTIEIASCAVQASRWDAVLSLDRYPALETPGYCQMSLTGQWRLASDYRGQHDARVGTEAFVPPAARKDRAKACFTTDRQTLLRSRPRSRILRRELQRFRTSRFRAA